MTLELSDKEEYADKLTALHIRVLGELLAGKEYDEIRSKYQKAFNLLNYEEIIINRANRLTFDEDGILIGAYPVSPLPTQHRITVAGYGTGYAMCAIDALGATHTFKSAVTIESTTTDDGNSIQFTLSAKEIPESDVVVAFDPLQYDSLQELVASNAQLAVDACPLINFYSNKSAVPENLKSMDFKTAIAESKAIFSQDAIKAHIRKFL